jgi:excisionase family DNA binding protein
MPSARPLMTTEEIAHMLNVTTKTIRRMVADGRLRAIKLGGDGFPNAKLWRFDPDEVEATLRRWGKGGDA